MQVVTSEVIRGKRVVLRYDFDIPLNQGVVQDDFRLRAGLETLKLCLSQATQITLIGHIGRPQGVDSTLSVSGIKKWFEEQGFSAEINQQKLIFSENLRFNPKEERVDISFAQELAKLGDVYINEAFAAYHEASSTTVLPSLLPAFAGLNFIREVEVLTNARNNPAKPLVIIIGGAKVEDKLPVVLKMAQVADAVLVGGKLPVEIKDQSIEVPKNVFVAKLNESETDLAPETVEAWTNLIAQAKQIVWNGPLGQVENSENIQTKVVAELILNSKAKSIVGGGDTIAALDGWRILDKFAFVSTGGGAMLKLLETGTLPTIEALS